MSKSRPSRLSSKGTKPGLYQFKITLLGIEPAIWRRIQVTDCSFDKLHEHIQTAMGWTNSHLHLFDINGKHCGDPELLGDGFEYVDSTRTLLSDLLPQDRKRLAFSYVYDFGDGWEHEVLFEGCPPFDPKAKYPLCLEGKEPARRKIVAASGAMPTFSKLWAMSNTTTTKTCWNGLAAGLIRRHSMQRVRRRG